MKFSLSGVQKVYYEYTEIEAETLEDAEEEYRAMVAEGKIEESDRCCVQIFSAGELCAECGCIVHFGSGNFVNRVPIFDDFKEREIAGYLYPGGEYICEECDSNERN